MNHTAISLQHEPSSAEEDDQYLTFKLDREMFAINILHIREIMEYGNLTTVPMMPEFIRGVINLRGSVVPVIDLQSRFGRGKNQTNRRSCIVILELPSDEQGAREIGLIVDEVSEVREIPASEIEPAPSFGARIRAAFISGMGKVDGNFVILLDVKKVLDVEEMAALTAIVDA